MPKILVFSNVHSTLCGEKALKDGGIGFQVIPVPPYVNEGCGLGIKLTEEWLPQALQVLKGYGIKVELVVDDQRVS